MKTPQSLDEAAVSENVRMSAPLEPLMPRESDRSNAADTLEESEASYHFLFEANPQPMWIHDCETFRFLLVNDAAIGHYGYSRDEFLSMTIMDIYPAEDVPLRSDALLNAMRSSVPNKGKRGVWRNRKKNGQIIDVDFTVNDLRFRGRAARLVMVNDVTDSRRIERALQQSEQEQRLLAEHLEKERERLAEAQAVAKVGSWDLNLTTNVLIWSEETYCIFGMDRNSFGASYEAFLERVHPDDRADVHRAYTESVANHTVYAIDHRMQMEDGSIKTVHERCKTIYDASGCPIRSVGTVQDITEQKQTERTLHHIMEGAHCLLWQAEIEEDEEKQFQWKMEFASEQAVQRFLPLHVPAGQTYGDTWYLSRPLEDRERTDLYGEQEIRAGRSYQQEFRCRSKDGALHWLSENVQVEALGEGKWRCTGVCTDITERKVAEEATRTMTRGAQCLLWYALVEEQPHGMRWLMEMPEEEAAQQFFPVKQSPEQSYVVAWTRSRMPEDSAIMDARSAAALRSGQQGYTQQFRCLRTDGEWRWLHETVSIEALTPGRWHCVGVCTDITEQKQAEEERDRFFTLSLDLLCVVAPNGHFVRLNPAFETVLGYTRAELMASPMLDFVHPDDREATNARIAQLNAGGNNLHFENRYRCRDGSYRWFAWTSTIFQGFRYGAAHDITPLKEAEIALRRAYEELEARVVDRTAQIMEVNTQLLIAKQEAERANQAKSEFLSRMSHELRTPLNAILGFGQILDRQPLTPLQEESVQYILTGGRHLLGLINEVLDLARVEAGHIELSLEPIALAEIVCESCALVRPLAAERDIFIEADPAAFGGSHVLADRQRLKQALINLLSNAIKYNRSNGQVRVYGVPRPDNRLCIAVQDTGPGITLANQQRLFVPFERLNAALTGVEGTGLGLAMAQRLVTAMGGSLTLESLPGEGTTFFLNLPLVPSPVEALAEHSLGSYESNVGRSEDQNATILYIEDNLSNMRLLEVLLRSRPGITLLPAMQGSIGLDLARQHVPDLILLDLNLPDISGKEVLARLQASALTRDIPVIILSADATASQIERLLTAGARAYLTKPLDVTEFLNTLDTILSDKEADSSLRP
jgi:PAS domain S-box-containing protein